MRLPVVSAVLVDRSLSSYFVNFGAHPQIQIALEHVLTEIFQNRLFYVLIDNNKAPFEGPLSGWFYRLDGRM